jgi:hypothetical protein
VTDRATGRQEWTVAMLDEPTIAGPNTDGSIAALPGLLAPVPSPIGETASPGGQAGPRLSPSCRFCDHARYTPVPGKVGCTLLSAMTGVQVLRSVDAQLHRLWRGQAHPAAYPDARVAPTDGFADSSVIVAATERCSRFKPRLSLA